MAQHEGVKYSEEGIPILELPEAQPLRLPKYTYETYEREQAAWMKTDRGESAWRTEQRRRWKDGFADLTGIHYFYLTQMKIKDAEGNLIRPMWRDIDEIALNEFLLCLADEIDLYVLKRREVGLSTIFGGLIPIYMAIMYPGSTSLMTSADLTRVTDLISEKFIAQHGALEDWVQPKRTSYDKSKGHVTLAEIDEDGKQTGNEARVICRQTSQDRKDVTNLEGARAKYAFLDELFLHPFPEEVRGSVESCLMTGMKRAGIMVAGGSANSISRLGLKEARNIQKSAQSGHVRMLFLSGAYGIREATIRDAKGKKISTENFCVNGWSDIPRATAYIMWQRAILDMNPNKTNLLSFIKRYPLTDAEVLRSDEAGIIPKDVADRIPEQETEIENNPRNLRFIRIINANDVMSFENVQGNTGGKVEFEPNGKWFISEPPIAGEKYIMGSDCIGIMGKKSELKSGQSNEEDRSFHASVIKRVSTNTYVGIYMVRTSDIDKIYEDLVLGQRLYNNCQNMIERNSAGNLYDRYKTDGNLNGLAYQPVWLGSKGFKKNTVRGIYKDANAERLYSTMFDYFREHMGNVDFGIILEQLRNFGLENTDIMDAIVMCEAFHRGLSMSDGARAKAVMAAQSRQKMYPVVKYDANGVRRIVMEPLYTDKDHDLIHGGQGMNWEPMTR